jgi:hypothetical protein
LKFKETELLNTLEEDLRKECTRPTLRQSVEDNQLKVGQAQGVCREVNFFKFISSGGIVFLCAQVPIERSIRSIHFEVQATDKLRKDSATTHKDPQRVAGVKKPLEVSERVNLRRDSTRSVQEWTYSKSQISGETVSSKHKRDQIHRAHKGVKGRNL